MCAPSLKVASFALGRDRDRLLANSLPGCPIQVEAPLSLCQQTLSNSLGEACTDCAELLLRLHPNLHKPVGYAENSSAELYKPELQSAPPADLQLTYS